MEPVPHIASAPESSGPNEVVDLRQQLLLLWRYRVAIIGVACLLGALGAAVSLLRTRQYEAAATLNVSASRLNNQTPAFVSPEGYVPLIATQAVAAKVIADLKLEDITPTELLNNDVTVRSVPNTTLLKVVARRSSADEAAAIANRMAEEGVASAARAGRIDVEAIEGEMKQMLDAATARLREAERAYDSYRTSARFEMLEREVDTLVGQRGELMDVMVELAGERARLTRLETDLATLTPVTPLKQSVVESPALAEAARATTPGGRDLLGLQMTREEPNTVYANVNEEAAKTRAHVAFLEQRRQRLTAEAGLNGSQMNRLTQLYERESMLERLNSELRLARDSYEEVATQYQGTRLASVGRQPQLLIVDPALAPDRPISRYLARNVLLGLTAGGLLGCVGVLLREALAGGRRG